MSIQRKDFSGGWNPSADAVNCPDNAFLRMDNCTLDENGVVAVRNGVTQVSSSLGTDVHSLYTATINGTLYNLIGVDDNVYRLGTGAIVTGIDTTTNAADIAFGSHMGQILMARGTTKKKYDGTARNWGIAAPSAPTASAAAGESKVYASCTSTESPLMTTLEGTQSFNANHSGTANGAVTILGDATTFRGSSTKTFASPTDFTTLSGSYAATDFDALEMYVYLTEPSKVTNVTLLVDVNDGTFTLDYYTNNWSGSEDTEVVIDEDQIFDSITTRLEYTGDVPGGTTYPIDGQDLREAQSHTVPRTARYSVFRQQAAGWNYMSQSRGNFVRVGSTAGKDWATVKAVRVFFDGTEQTTVRFDSIQTVGGLHGEYYYRTVYVREGSNYIALSPPSPPSAKVTGDNFKATVSWSASSDTGNVTHVYVYRIGGTMDGYYRVQRIAVGTTTVDDTSSDATALLTNLSLGVDDIVPPSGIVGIEGPYFQRTLAIGFAPGATSGNATHLYISHRNNPDTFRTSWAIRIGDGSENCYWIKKAFGGVYIGTSKDIYRVTGDLAELPDGTLDVKVEPINIAYPPLNNGVAQEGNYLCYVASDGWRTFTGQDSQHIRGKTELLWRGYTRHGVNYVNITDATARFRGAIANGYLWTTIPEYPLNTSSLIVWRYHFASGEWNRFTMGYFTTGIRTIYRKPDGTIIAGDYGGQVGQLDSSANPLDNATGIAVAIWTKVDNGGNDLQRKDPQDLFLRLDTGNVAAGVALYLDGSGSAALNVNATLNGQGIYEYATNALATFRQVQMKLTITATAGFKLYEYAHRYRELPNTTHFMENKPAAVSGRRKRFGGLSLLLDTHNAAVTVTPVLDGVDQSTFTVTHANPLVYNHKFTASTVGRDLWVKIGVSGAGTPFEFYDFKPIIEMEMPDQVAWFENRPTATFPTRRRFGGLQINIDTLGNTITGTPVLDGVDQSTFTVSTTSGIPLVYNHKFTAEKIGRDLWVRLTGTAFELYGFAPIVEQELPAQVSYYENRPAILSANRKRFSGVTLTIDTLGNTATITPVLDGADQTPITTSTTSGIPLTKNLTFATVVGKDLWVRITATAFELYGQVQPVVVGELPPLVRSISPTDAGYPCEKVITGVNFRVTTPTAATPFFVYGDGAQIGSFGLTTASTTDPELYAFQLATPTAYKELYFTSTYDVELYEFTPMVLYKNPCYRSAWDTGFINITPDDFAWIRFLSVKLKSATNVTAKVYVDGALAATKTIVVNPNVVEVYEVQLGREVKGTTPRVQLTVSGSFQPYWCEIWYRGSGNEIQKKRINVRDTP